MVKGQHGTNVEILDLAKRSGSTLTLLCGVVISCLVAVVLVAIATPSSSYADEPLPAAAASYPTGKITSIYERTFQIDGRTVSLAPEVVLVDRHGDPLAVTDLRVDIDVKYHIQKGTTDKIDWMLLILPE
ncbi:MAG: hypothetical protein HOP35_08215 [Nitrospira sp.]|nr:hypothetical protein [Nitrospira sp.]